MTADAREEILARIRAALTGAPPRSRPEVPRDYASSRAPANLLDHFVERVADYRAVVERVAADNLPGAVAEACTRYGVGTLALAADAPDAWTSALDGGVQLVRDAPSSSRTPKAHHR